MAENVCQMSNTNVRKKNWKMNGKNRWKTRVTTSVEWINGLKQFLH